MTDVTMAPVPSPAGVPGAPVAARPPQAPQYVPGAWVAVVAHDDVALLPATTPDATVHALWESVHASAGVVQHLQALTGGLTSLPPFALLSVTDGRLHAVVRGAVEVEVVADGVARVLTAPDVTTWTEQVVDAVEAVVVRAPGVTGDVDGGALPLVHGVVRAGAVRLAVRSAAAVLTAVLTTELADLPTDVPTGPAPAPVALPELVVVPADLGPVEDTLLRPVAEPAVPVVEAAAPVVEPELLADAEAQPDAAPDLAAAEVAAVPVPLADVLADHDGTTVLSADVVALRAQLPDWAGHALATPAASTVTAVPTPHPTPTARLALSTGDVVGLDRPVLLGRAPQVSRVASAQVPRLVTVPSPQQDISRTHAEVRLDGDDVVLTDLRSTNGVLVVRPNAAPQRLQPGEATVVQPGVVVDLGEGVTFTVELDA